MATRINGLLVVHLTPEELAWFEAEIASGRASRSYAGASGFFGIAKVHINCQE